MYLFLRPRRVCASPRAWPGQMGFGPNGPGPGAQGFHKNTKVSDTHANISHTNVRFHIRAHSVCLGMIKNRPKKYKIT